MVGELNLNTLLSTMTATLVEGVYVFVTLKNQAVPTALSPRMTFVEAEGTTLIVTKDEAEAASLDYEFPCRMISLEVHSALEAVGFIAHIATELAKADMGVNPVSGFYHDHLFVPDGRQDDGLRILQRIANEF